MDANMQNHRFIFICGLHRSGTSILFRSLRDHPEISGFRDTPSPEDEGMHLQTVYPPSGHYGGAGEFGFHPEAHLTETSHLVSQANREELFAGWSRYWDLEKAYLLEKSPPNLIRTRFLQAMFPNAFFIVLMRHPLAVTYATRAWYRKYRIYWRSFSRIFEHWLACHEIFQADRRYLENVMVVKYEHFVADPDRWMGDICAFLGLNEHLTRQEILPNVNEKYFNMWRKDFSGVFSGRAARSVIERYETRLNPFGYSLVDLDWAALPEE